MVAQRTRRPNGSAETPALASVAKCPNCGREPAVVFPLLREYDRPAKDATFVCMKCYPKVPAGER